MTKTDLSTRIIEITYERHSVLDVTPEVVVWLAENEFPGEIPSDAKVGVNLSRQGIAYLTGAEGNPKYLGLPGHPVAAWPESETPTKWMTCFAEVNGDVYGRSARLDGDSERIRAVLGYKLARVLESALGPKCECGETARHRSVEIDGERHALCYLCHAIRILDGVAMNAPLPLFAFAFSP